MKKNKLFLPFAVLFCTAVCSCGSNVNIIEFKNGNYVTFAEHENTILFDNAEAIVNLAKTNSDESDFTFGLTLEFLTYGIYDASHSDMDISNIYFVRETDGKKFSVFVGNTTIVFGGEHNENMRNYTVNLEKNYKDDKYTLHIETESGNLIFYYFDDEKGQRNVNYYVDNELVHSETRYVGEVIGDYDFVTKDGLKHTSQWTIDNENALFYKERLLNDVNLYSKSVYLEWVD